MADLGRAALVVSLGLVLYAALGGAYGAWKGRRRVVDSARNALLAAFGSTAVAAAVLWIALARHDFSFTYVAGHPSRELPLGYTLSAFWGGQEGSLLLWLLVLTGYGAAAGHLHRHASRAVIAWGGPVVGGGAVLAGPRPPRLLVRLRRRPHEPRAAARLHAFGLLGRTGGIAPALAARADRLRRGRGPPQPSRLARRDRLGRAGDRRRRDV